MQLPIQLRAEVCRFIKSLPNMQSSDARLALLLSASLDEELLAQIDVAGPLEQFCELLVQTLVSYEKLKDNRDALAAVLEASKDRVGVRGQQVCDGLIAEWRQVRQQSTDNRPKIQPSAARRYYLNSLFERVGFLRISRIKPDQKERVALANVYVDLPTNLSLSIQVRSYQIVDWRIERFSDSQELTNVELSKSNFGDYDVQTVEEIIGEAQALIDGKDGNISLEEKRRPFILSPLWSDRVIKDYETLNTLDIASIINRLVIVGAPGSGKSTFAQYLTLCLLAAQLDRSIDGIPPQNEGRWSFRRATPIYVELHQLMSWRKFPDPDQAVTANHFWQYLQEELLEPNQGFTSELWNDLINGFAVIILDGIDEVPIPLERIDSQQQRQRQVVELAQSISNRFPQSRIVFTSRRYGYEPIRAAFEADGYKTVSLMPLDQTRMLQLASNLYRGVGLEHEPARAKANLLLRELASVSGYLKNRPLFLTLMATLFLSSEKEQLPNKKASLLHQSIFLLLDRWTQARLEGDSQKPLSKEDTKLLYRLSEEDTKLLYLRLENIGYRAQDQAAVDLYQTSDLDIGEIYRELDVFRVRMFEIKDYLTQQAGIFEQIGEMKFRFAHRAFQEFLAASYLIRSGNYDAVREHIQTRPLVWREPCLLLGDLLAENPKGETLLWDLVRTLLAYDPSIYKNSTQQHWYAVWLASSIVVEQKLYSYINEHERIANKLKDRIKLLLNTPLALRALDRVQAAQALGFLVDDRPGVGVRDELPDIAWCKIPAGEFRMGTSEQQIQEIRKTDWAGEWGFDAEIPAHPIYLSEFYIARYPITRAQFRVFVEDDGGYKNEEWWPRSGLGLRKEFDPPSYSDEDLPDNLPQTNVNWYEAVAFCNWLTAKLGEKIRLPTEAEWEKAARGNDSRIFPWGNQFDPELCNVYATGIGSPCPVGSFASFDSPWGTEGPMDMCGNVWEWCTTINQREGGEVFKYPYKDDEDRENYDAGDEFMRSVRGGSYTNVPFLARSTFRGRDRPSFRHRRQGFRVVKINSGNR
jgi:formylglycine-generating enzyme required for sulfatase activity